MSHWQDLFLWRFRCILIWVQSVRARKSRCRTRFAYVPKVQRQFASSRHKEWSQFKGNRMTPLGTKRRFAWSMKCLHLAEAAVEPRQAWSQFGSQETWAVESNQIRSIIYGLLAPAPDRRPAVPSRRQASVRLRDDPIDLVGPFCPRRECSPH